jgi:mycothiol synthase
MHAWTQVVSRAYAPERDWARVRQLLLDTFPLTPPGFNWDVRRWDGNRTHHADLNAHAGEAGRVRLWETVDGQLVGAAHGEGSPGDVWLELHPDFRFLMDDMLAWAETTLAAPDTEFGGQCLTHFTFDYDTPRQQVLSTRGYVLQPGFGVLRRLRFGGWPIPDAPMAEGYRLRTTRPLEQDYAAVAVLLNAAFGRTVHSAQEYRNFSTQSPSFRHDLDLVAEAADGTLAALVGVTFDAVNRHGMFEPVCTHPQHLRRGLARSLVLEGMRRLHTEGALDATVDTGDAEAANAFYDAMGFTEAYRGHYWCKHLT